MRLAILSALAKLLRVQFRANGVRRGAVSRISATPSEVNLP